MTSQLVKSLRYGAEGSYERLAAVLEETPAYTLCGHMKAKPLARAFGPARMITLLREPVAQVVSHYRHIRRRGQFQGTLMEFAVQDCARNIQTRHVRPIGLERWLFVGRQDRLAADAARLSELIGVRVTPERVNAAPDGPAGELGANERRRILDLNALDAELFETLQDMGAPELRRFHESDMQSA